LLGGLLVWFLLPRIVVMPVPVNPETGVPLKEFLENLPPGWDTKLGQRNTKQPPAPVEPKNDPGEKKPDGH
jgi:hypothetical protein